MLKELKYIIDLQKIDNQLLEIDDLKGDLPQLVEGLKQEIKELEDGLKKEKNREAKIILEAKELEGSIEDDKTYLHRYQDQLYLVTSNKEYDALTSEIDTKKQNIDKAEYSILELNEEKERLAESIKMKELTYEKKVKEIAEKTKQLNHTNQKTSDIQGKLNIERQILVSKISSRFIREYTRIAQAKDGIAIVPIQQIFEEKVDKKGNIEYIPAQVSCGGCHKIVPPQKIVEIRAGNQINRCEFCGRMLYWDTDASEIRSGGEEEIF